MNPVYGKITNACLPVHLCPCKCARACLPVRVCPCKRTRACLPVYVLPVEERPFQGRVKRMKLDRASAPVPKYVQSLLNAHSQGSDLFRNSTKPTLTTISYISVRKTTRPENHVR
jgi:hypothetical protein